MKNSILFFLYLTCGSLTATPPSDTNKSLQPVEQQKDETGLIINLTIIQNSTGTAQTTQANTMEVKQEKQENKPLISAKEAAVAGGLVAGGYAFYAGCNKIWNDYIKPATVDAVGDIIEAATG